jgi:succinoglycan biosynthesis protein ExoM
LTVLRLTILFCTFRRSALLRNALQSVLNQHGLDRVALDIVVVDNSDEGSAEAVVAEMAALAPFPIRYLAAHPANISVARNAAVAAATGEIIAFLDDDMEIGHGWLAAVIDGVSGSDHDVYFGPVEPVFEDPALASPQARAMFTRTLALDAGDELFAMGPRKTRGFVLATSNSIFRARMFTDAEPFDPALGQSGGEDLDLFCRLERRGARFRYLPDARAREFVPVRRCAIDYLVARHFSGGQVFAFCMIKNSDRPMLAAASIRLKTIVQFALLALTLTLPRLRRDDRRIRLAALAGKFSWRRLYPLYRREEPKG